MRQFREAVYQQFLREPNAGFECVDAIASSPHARSAVEISLSPLMQRKFSSVYKALERIIIDVAGLIGVLTKQALDQGTLEFQGYAIFALDHTPYPRKDAPTLTDRSYVHGADGVVIGHQYSLLGRVMHETGAWIGVCDCERIPTDRTPAQVGAEQISRLAQNTARKCIITMDSEYGCEEILAKASENMTILVRLRSNRTLYKQPDPRKRGQRGAPKKHGRKIKFTDLRTMGKPDQVIHFKTADGGGVEVVIFSNLHLKSAPTVNGHLIWVQAFRPDASFKYTQPLWLFWTGPADMDWHQFWRVYLKRFCIESVNQFAKNSLAWTRARLGYTLREERWTWLVMLAYWQLLLSVNIANDARLPWQKPMPEGRLPTPARVQRDYFRIFVVIGTPAAPPKRRGNSLGRPKGYCPQHRPRLPVVYKGINSS
jgi:hypothetical protein